MKRLLTFFMLLMLVCDSNCQGADAGSTGLAKGDSHIEGLLGQLGLEYQLSENGHYLIKIEMGDERPRLVGITGSTYQLGGIQLRSIYVFGGSSEQPFDTAMLTTMLSINGQLLIGAWKVESFKNTNYAIYEAAIPADIDLESLQVAIRVVIHAGKLLEEMTTGTDET